MQYLGYKRFQPIGIFVDHRSKPNKRPPPLQKKKAHPRCTLTNLASPKWNSKGRVDRSFGHVLTCNRQPFLLTHESDKYYLSHGPQGPPLKGSTYQILCTSQVWDLSSHSPPSFLSAQAPLFSIHLGHHLPPFSPLVGLHFR